MIGKTPVVQQSRRQQALQQSRGLLRGERPKESLPLASLFSGVLIGMCDHDNSTHCMPVLPKEATADGEVRVSGTIFLRYGHEGFGQL